MIPDIPESLPPLELMPDRVYALPELRDSVRLNVGAELLDRQADGDHAVRPAKRDILRRADVVPYDAQAASPAP